MPIQISSIDPNPYRPTDPWDDVHVEKIKLSIEQNGLLPGIVLRPYPKMEGRWQIVCGHNRMEALRRLQWSEVDAPGVVVRDLTDAQAVAILIHENATQRGHTPAMVQQAIGAAQRHLAEILLKHESYDAALVTSQQVVETCFDSKNGGRAKSFDTNQGLLLEGRGLGEKLVERYIQGMRNANPDIQAISTRDIREAVAVLRAGGDVGRMLEHVANLLEDAGNQTAAEVARSAVKRAEVVTPKKFDSSASTAFERTSSRKVFREEVTAPGKEIPVSEQRQLAERIIKEATDTGARVTDRFVRAQVAEHRGETCKSQVPTETPHTPNHADLNAEATASYERLLAAAETLKDAAAKLAGALRDGGIVSGRQIKTMYEEIKAIENDITHQLYAVVALCGAPSSEVEPADLSTIGDARELASEDEVVIAA